MGNLAKEHFDKKAEQSKKNKQAGGNNVIIDLVGKVKVRFTKDYGFIKAGHEQFLSETAYEIYADKKVVEKIN
jgi:hypothetical protein